MPTKNLKTTTVEVAYINEPKSATGPGSIKDINGVLFKVWPQLLSKFEAGNTYEISFEESEWNNAPQYTVRGIKSPAENIKGATVDATPLKTKPNGQYRNEAGPRESERMFVCGALNAAIHGGQVSIDNEESVKFAVKMLRKTWAETFGAD